VVGLFCSGSYIEVQQFDHHLPTLTVEETMTFSAKMRMPIETTESEISSLVFNILNRLELMHCKGTMIGNADMKGISGGEKRRVSIGIQLLTDPPIVLLDEPTTGLDAFTARHVMETLKKEVSRPRSFAPFMRTLVLTIHQPRYDIFRNIDEVVLLSRAQLVYAGPAQEVKVFFEQTLKIECPSMHNPADFILDYSSVDVSSTKCNVVCLVCSTIVVVSRIDERWKRNGIVEETTRVGGHLSVTCTSHTTSSSGLHDQCQLVRGEW
jgi:ATP-binding cassette, subfamily G (WHITE), member 8 (sterolin 2)